MSGPDSAVRFRLFTDIPRTVRFVWTDSVQTRMLQISVRARIELKRLAPGVLHASIVGEPNLAAPALVQRLGPEVGIRPSAYCLQRATSTSASSAGTQRLCTSCCRPQRSSAAGRPASVIPLRRSSARGCKQRVPGSAHQQGSAYLVGEAPAPVEADELGLTHQLDAVHVGELGARQ